MVCLLNGILIHVHSIHAYIHAARWNDWIDTDNSITSHLPVFIGRCRCWVAFGNSGRCFSTWFPCSTEYAENHKSIVHYKQLWNNKLFFKSLYSCFLCFLEHHSLSNHFFALRFNSTCAEIQSSISIGAFTWHGTLGGHQENGHVGQSPAWPGPARPGPSSGHD